MDKLEAISFQIISAVGTARSLYIEAIQEAKNKNYSHVKELIDEGNKLFTEGHRAHAQLIQDEANFQDIKVSLLLAHAEDQLMSADGFKIIANEFIDLYKRIDK